MQASHWDFVVVGSGSAGAVVAHRLSERPDTSVLLIEAGPQDSSIWLKVPLGFGKVHFSSRFTWQHATLPEPRLGGRGIAWVRGKVLGGSSSVNGLVYVRGDPSDYDEWDRLGATGWSYRDVLPFFKKAECQHRGEDEFHGGAGPLHVEDARWRTGLADAFIESASACGIPRNDDFSGARLEGAGYFQLTTNRGVRSSAATAYLRPVRSRRNLTVVTGALVHRVTFEGQVATGVVYEQGGRLHHALAHEETVLSAGTVNTPQILQLSGIGDPALLAAHGVPLVCASPGVGENLSDHLLASRVFRTRSADTFNATMRTPFSRAAAGLRYVLARSGPLAIGAGQAGAFARTREGLEAPDVQIFFAPYAGDKVKGKLAPYSGFALSTYQNRPESRGHVRIRSSDPRQLPEIVANYLATERDRATLVAGLQLLGRIADASPLDGFIEERMNPRASTMTDDELLAHAAQVASTPYHHVGTARMGGDRLAVVDPRLRVRGVHRLRVVDGSVMPTVISGNTQAACVMIGEKGAHHIEADRTKPA